MNKQNKTKNKIQQASKKASKQREASKCRSYDLPLARQQTNYGDKASPFCGQKDRLVKTSVGILEAPADESDAEGA